MRSEQMWLDDELAPGAPSLTRRGVLAGSLKLLGGGALALTLSSVAGQERFALAQDDSTPEAEAEGEAAGEIQVGTTDDAAGDTAAEGEAEVAADADLPAVEGETEEEREARRAARQAEEGVGAAVGAVPSTGVGALGPSLGGVIGAIGLAAATGAAAFFTRRQGADSDEAAG